MARFFIAVFLAALQVHASVVEPRGPADPTPSFDSSPALEEGTRNNTITT